MEILQACRFQLNLVQAGDGSGKGAALVAAIAQKLEGSPNGAI